MSYTVPYMVNPKRISVRKKRKSGLPPELLSEMVELYGPAEGMKEAWKIFKAEQDNPRKLTGKIFTPENKHRPVIYGKPGAKKWYRSSYSKSPQINPLGSSVLVVGTNSKNSKRKGGVYMKTKRRHKRNDPGRRHNPATTKAESVNIMKILEAGVFVGAGYFGANFLPSILGSSITSSPVTRIGIKSALGVGAAMFLKGEAGAYLAAGALGNAMLDAVNSFLFPITTTASGFGAIVNKTTLAPSKEILPPKGTTMYPHVQAARRGPLHGFGANYALTPYTVNVPNYPS